MQTKTTTKKTTQTTSVADQRKLAALKKRIVDGHKTTEQLIKSTKEKARQALEEAILVGKALADAKALIPYGGFTRWIEKECKLNDRTAQRYIQLVKETSHVSGQSPTNLRKAYIALGIIDDPTTDSPAPARVSEARAASSSHVMDTANYHTVASTLRGSQPAKSTDRRLVVDTTTTQEVVTKPKATLEKPTIQKEDALSRAKYLVTELNNELTSKLNNELLNKYDARQILQPLLDLLDDGSAKSNDNARN